MNASMMSVAVVTVDREPPYVNQTVATLFAADPLAHALHRVHLIAGTSDARYLDHFRHYGYEYYGARGMYYPAHVARRLRDHVWAHGVQADRAPFDMLAPGIRPYGVRRTRRR